MGRAQRPAISDPHIQMWSGQQFVAHVDEAMAIYVRAMQYPAYTGTQRAVTARRHVTNEGFECRAALGEDGTMLGFGYGYSTRPGQWWHDLVRMAMTNQAADDWLTESFELSELHVLPEHQGQGIGRRLLASLATGIPHRAMLLSTPDSDTRAFQLYRHVGFVDLARHYLFPGDSRPFAVLGARLPLVMNRIESA
ncbi:MAG: GNAT family N-acetyltransferase [Jatrophihabitantaceae bacterium]